MRCAVSGFVLAFGGLLTVMGCDRGRPHLASRSVQEWFAVIRDSGDARGDAHLALVRLAWNHPESMDAVVDGLGAGDAAVRLAAAQTLLALGVHATSTVEPLKRVAEHDREVEVRAMAARALGSVTAGESWGLATLEAALRDSAALVRGAAADGLGLVGGVAKRSISTLAFVASNDPNAGVREAAARAVARITKSP